MIPMRLLSVKGFILLRISILEEAGDTIEKY